MSGNDTMRNMNVIFEWVILINDSNSDLCFVEKQMVTANEITRNVYFVFFRITIVMNLGEAVSFSQDIK